MSKILRVLLVVLLVVVLAVIRGYVSPYFYDPLRDYFKFDYFYNPLPIIHFKMYFFNLFLRYFLNSIVSLLIIYVVFRSVNILKFSIKFYIFSFVVLSFLLFITIKLNVTNNTMLLFYVRRFLIHPLFVIVLIPAFYYQKLKMKNLK